MAKKFNAQYVAMFTKVMKLLNSAHNASNQSRNSKKW